MTVNKITNPPSQKGVIDKINEVIDNLGGGGSVDIDNKSITTNTSDELQTVGVIDQNNTSNAIKTWTGTKAQYDAIVTKDTNTLYWVTDSKVIYLGDNAVGNFSGGRNVGEIVSSSLPLTDAGLHLLDGSLLQYGIYKEFIDYIADLYAENPSASYWTTEALWQQSITDYGVCGKFVYDSVNNTVRLPKVTGFVEGANGVANLGDLTQAGLPNITGQTYLKGATQGGNAGTGALTGSGASGSISSGGGSGSDNNWLINLDASYSSSIYGSSNTVQPQSVKVLYYIVVATSTKTDIEVDIDEIATDLNGKADVDLTNTAATLSNDFLSKLMPDYENTVDISATVTTTSTQNRSYSYPIMLYFASSCTDVSGGYIKFTCGNFETNTQGYNYSLVSDTLFIPANTNFTLYCPIQPNRSRKAYIIPLKGGNQQ